MLHGLRKLVTGVAVAGLAVAVLGVHEAQGQRGGRAGGLQGPAAMRGALSSGVERAIRLADELELTEDQRGQLEELRHELVELRATAAVRTVELGSEVRAGLSEPESLRREMRDIRSAQHEAADAAREELEGVLTEAQMDELTEMGRSARGQRGFRNRRGPGQDFGRRQGMRRRGPGA